MSSAGAYASTLINEYGVDPADIGTRYDVDSLDVVLDAFSKKDCSECEVGRYGDLVRCDECYDAIMTDFYYEREDTLSDAEADAMTLASAGYGTDEDYGFYGYEEEY